MGYFISFKLYKFCLILLNSFKGKIFYSRQLKLSALCGGRISVIEYANNKTMNIAKAPEIFSLPFGRRVASVLVEEVIEI